MTGEEQRNVWFRPVFGGTISYTATLFKKFSTQFFECGKTISNHSQHWKRESDLDGDLYDAITCTKPSRQHQTTRMSNKVTSLLREQQLEEVIKTRRSFVHPSSLLVRTFEDYQSAQSVFAIQVRIIEPVVLDIGQCVPAKNQPSS